MAPTSTLGSWRHQEPQADQKGHGVLEGKQTMGYYSGDKDPDDFSEHSNGGFLEETEFVSPLAMKSPRLLSSSITLDSMFNEDEESFFSNSRHFHLDLDDTSFGQQQEIASPSERRFIHDYEKKKEVIIPTAATVALPVNRNLPPTDCSGGILSYSNRSRMTIPSISPLSKPIRQVSSSNKQQQSNSLSMKNDSHQPSHNLIVSRPAEQSALPLPSIFPLSKPLRQASSSTQEQPKNGFVKHNIECNRALSSSFTPSALPYSSASPLSKPIRQLSTQSSSSKNQPSEKLSTPKRSTNSLPTKLPSMSPLKKPMRQVSRQSPSDCSPERKSNKTVSSICPLPKPKRQVSRKSSSNQDTMVST